MTSPQVQWKAPSGRQQAGVANKIADLLRANKGEWAIIEEYPVPVVPEDASPEQVETVKAEARRVRAKASSRASLIKQGRVAAFRSLQGTAGAFRAVSRSEADDDGKRVIRVYAIYDGEEAAEAPQPKAAPAADGSGEEAPAETVSPEVVEETVADESVAPA